MLAILLSVALLIMAIQSVAFSRDFFNYQFRNNNINGKLGVSDEALNKITEKLLGYIDGTYEDLDVSVTMHGRNVQVFNKKEKKHMADVKELFGAVDLLKIICLVSSLAMLLLVAAILKKEAVNILAKYVLIGLAIFICFLLVIFIWTMVDFSSFWTVFHKLAFSNDLWMLDPLTDRLIVMLPESVFAAAVTNIGIRFFTSMVIVAVACTGAIFTNKYIKKAKERFGN